MRRRRRLLLLLLGTGSGIPEGFPTEENTGTSGALTAVPGSVTEGSGWFWDDVNGFLRVNGDAATLDSLDVDGEIYIDGKAGTVISNTRCHGIACEATSSTTTVEDCTITGPDAYNYTGITMVGINSIVRRCNISNFENCISWSGSNGQVVDNYCHSPISEEDEQSPHIDGIEGGTDATINLLIQGNTMIMMPQASSCISLNSAGITVDSNYLRGGAYVVRLNYQDTVTLTNNYLGKAPSSFGYYTNEGGGSGNPTISGNIDADTLENIE